MGEMLSVKNINVYYGSIHAIKDVSFHVNEGEIVTLIGANGAGKTTTMHAISGLLKLQMCIRDSVKNVMNACYLGVDSHGLHFSLKDSASLNMEADGKVLINGAMGITGIKKASTFTIGIVLVIITRCV